MTVRKARVNRKGKGYFPPNPKQWDAERRGLEVRDRLGSGLDGPLDIAAAFSLLQQVRLFAVSELSMAQKFVDRLHGSGSSEWSGAAVAAPTGETWVIHNDAHSDQRIRATLMEEFFHLYEGHPPSVIRLHESNGARRTYDSSVEGDAYQMGAAALVPYRSLRSMLLDGVSVSSIAKTFDVSPALVEFRAKVTKQWRLAG